MINLKILQPSLSKYKKIARFLRTIDRNKIYSNFGPLYQKSYFKVNKFLNLKKKDLTFTSSCFASLLAALLLIRSNKKYCIVSAFSFSADVHPIILAGYEPYFIDISKDTLHPELDNIENIPLHIIKNLACAILTSPFGYPISNQKLNQIQKKLSVPVIYDAADTFLNLKDLDQLEKNILIACSFHPTKTLPSNESGLLIHDKKFSKKLRSIVNFGIKNSDRNISQLSINGKFSEYDAAIFLANFNDIKKIKNECKRIHDIYLDSFKKIYFCKYFNGKNTFYYSSKSLVIFDKINFAKKVKNFFIKNGIYVYLPWGKKLICNEKPFIGYKRAKLTVAEKIIKTYLFLPNYFGIKKKAIHYVCNILREI
jgi:dTDP-4-amino-4,6-dideoxygalactose transaminase